jgi:hypothetical protein
MRNTFRFLRILVGIVLVTAWECDGLSAQAPAGFRSLTLSLSVPPRSFLLLEPVPVTIALENRTAEPIVAHTALSFTDRAVAVLIQPEGLPAYRVEQLSPIAIRTRHTPETLPPGYRQVSTEPLILHLQKILPTPGKYGIQAVLRNLDGDEIRSNVVNIDVIQPAGMDQLAYLSLVDSGTVDSFLVGSGVAGNRERYDAYEMFARTYQGTVYGDYANLSLGQLHEARREIDVARKFYASVTTRNEYAAQQAAEALKRLPAP